MPNVFKGSEIHLIKFKGSKKLLAGFKWNKTEFKGCEMKPEIFKENENIHQTGKGASSKYVTLKMVIFTPTPPYLTPRNDLGRNPPRYVTH